MFDRELQYFIDNQAKLVRRYGGKTLVLKDGGLAGVFDDPGAAYMNSKKKFAAGTFMIQPCRPGPDAYTVSISAANALVR